MPIAVSARETRCSDSSECVCICSGSFLLHLGLDSKSFVHGYCFNS